jgi:ABC-type uncharacterized transport system ATPase component
MPGPFTSPVARSVPFDNSTNGFIASETQSAIEEVKNLFMNTSSFAIIAGRSASTGAGVFLDFIAGNSSDTSPFVAIQNVNIRGLSAAGTSSTTCVVGLYKNGNLASPVATVTLTAQSSNYVNSLTVPLVAGDTISVRVVSGSILKPFVTIYFSG